MSKVAIVIDSTTNLPKDLMQKFEITSAPASIIWGEDKFRDGIDIQANEFYARLGTSEDMPTTSQATPFDFKKIYEDLLGKGFDILTIVISSKLSGTFTSAMQARQSFRKAKIEVIDSLTGAMGTGWPVLEAAKAARQGVALGECKEIAKKALKNTGVLLTVDTLEFLHRGGRIGSAQRFLGTALNFKPILEVANGAFEGLERVRTRQKALGRLVDLVEARVGNRKEVHLAALHANAQEVAAQLMERAGQKIKLAKRMVAEVSPAVGVHLGPGTVGLAYMTENE